jgi:hypothetical protein
MATIEGIAAQAGFSRTVLSVMPSRAGAIAFYQANGYTPLTEDVDWPWPAVWLSRALINDTDTAS